MRTNYIKGHPHERFWPKVEFTASCWIWKAYRNKRGYGEFNRGGHRSVLAHRWAYQELVGPIPDGLTLDHLCRVTSCVNPDHLEPVTRAVNTLRQPYSAPQWSAAKTHCPAGHEFTPENTMRYGQKLHSGGMYFPRKCKTCHYAREAVKRERRRATRESRSN